MIHSLPKILLASKSPRRQELLTAAHIPFTMIEVNVEESFPAEMDAEDVPEYLAKKKADAAISFIKDTEVILAADSVVIKNNEIYNKPEDRAEAIEMIKTLAGHKHLVITGVYLLGLNKTLGFSEYTYVWIDKMSEEEIEFYIDQFKPFDKAGSYGIQDWIGWAKVSRIEGSYANVMGLPVQRVYEELREW